MQGYILCIQMIYFFSQQQYLNKEHSQNFDSNLDSVKSLLTNSFFGSKEMPGTGDCGFICLIIGINSDNEILQWFNKKILELYKKLIFGKVLDKI